MRVVLLSTKPPDAQVREMLAALRHGGLDARLYASDLGASTMPAPTVANELGARVRGLTDDWRPDVLHAMDPLAGVAAHIASGRRAAVVQQLRSLASVERRASVTPHDYSRAVLLERRLLRRASVVIAGCTDQAMELIQLRVPAGRVRVVEAAVDPRRFDVAAYRGSFHESLRLLHPGGTDPSSGVVDVVQALVRVPQARLAVAGGTASGADDLRRLARRLHVGHRVAWLGSLQSRDLPGAYRASHVVVQAPWRSWSSRTALEAVAARRPLVASATGALVDGLSDLLDVSLVPVHSPDAIAAALSQLQARPPGEREAGVEAARTAMVRKHSWSARLRVIVEVYESAIANRRAGSEVVLGVA